MNSQRFFRSFGASRAPLAVVCAMECELVHLRTALAPQYVDWHGGRCTWLTSLDGAPIVLACCGIGMASAAAVTEALIQRHRPTALLNYGCSGAHRDDLLPGDLVIGARVVAQDRVMLEADGTERYLGMWYLHGTEAQKVDYLPASPDLLALATNTATLLAEAHEPWPPSAGWPASVPHRLPRAVTGTIVSSDRWTRFPNRIRHLATTHESSCEDMEAAAIALTCASHDLPFLAVKDISNNELLRTTDDSFSAETDGQLGRRAGAFVFALLRQLVSTPRADEILHADS